MTVHELLKYLCIETKVVSYEYFMDNLQNYELNTLMLNANYSYKNEWEICRYEAYCSLSPYMKKKTDLHKFLPLSTDEEENKDEHVTEISNEDIQRMSSLSQKFQKIIQKQDNG